MIYLKKKTKSLEKREYINIFCTFVFKLQYKNLVISVKKKKKEMKNKDKKKRRNTRKGIIHRCRHNARALDMYRGLEENS